MSYLLTSAEFLQVRSNVIKIMYRRDLVVPVILLLFLDTDVFEVKRVRNDLRYNCAVGIDDRSTIFLQKYKDILIAPLTCTFNLSFLWYVAKRFKESTSAPGL